MSVEYRRRRNTRANNLIGLGAILGLAMLVCISFSLFYWGNTKVDHETAQMLLQKVVRDRQLEGEVTDVLLSAEVCTPIQYGNACRVDVQFKLNKRVGSGWCTYGIRLEPACGITAFLE